MGREALTGSRIRERRSMAKLKQAEMARMVGISASYLNLIEHNRRRIGGKLLLDIAEVLGVDAQLLTDGAEAALVATLKDAATVRGLAAQEIELADEFAGRFPGWADVLAETRKQVADLERSVEALNDRLANDPYLADAMHELLSTAAAVRSTAAILAETKSLRPEWRARFHANIDEDSRRLSESAQALVSYLDVKGEGTQTLLSPAQEVDAFVSARGYAFPALETAEADDKTVATLVRGAQELVSQAARNTAVDLLSQVMRDGAQVGLTEVRAAYAALGADPIALATELRCSVPVILRRLAALPELGAGLITCDRSGAVLFRKPLKDSETQAKTEAALQAPLYAALGTPGIVLSQWVPFSGASGHDLICFATGEVAPAERYNHAPALTAVMLILPDAHLDASSGLTDPARIEL
ncbi:MAG: helix-turn-helix domain-containing protein [Pseudomonadota bacterium]